VARGEGAEVNGRAAAGPALRLAAAFAASLFGAAPAAAAQVGEQHSQADVPYYPTPPQVVEAMLKLADVGPKDYVIDLGSGDGRILIAAARSRGARGLGVEIDAVLVDTARDMARRAGVADRVKFIEENLFTTELDRATVLAMYLYPRVMAQLQPRLFAELRPGARIVSHEFAMEGWAPDARATVPVPDKPYGPPSSEVLLWIMPANAAGAWRWRLGDRDYDAELTQSFQVLQGRARAGGREARVEQGRVRGDEIRFILGAGADGQAVRQELVGRVSGDTISGRISAGGASHDWRATRVRRGSIKFSDE